MTLNIIVGMTKDRVIGKANDLPWYLPEDLKNFKRLTLGHPCIMGRKTFESIVDRIGKPLPGRANIVLSRSLEWDGEGDVAVFSDLSDALRYARTLDDELYVIGGTSVYEQTMPLADRLCVSWVHGSYEGDTYFPEFSEEDWEEAEREERDGFTYVEYVRV